VVSKLSDKEWVDLINNIIVLTETGMRLGETYMVSLSKINIDLYKEVVGTKCDTLHKEENIINLVNFLNNV
tara:strand:+ start:405 stop:617 length:213 start_codon:yes stop_codon:yes gene_type:complete